MRLACSVLRGCAFKDSRANSSAASKATARWKKSGDEAEEEKWDQFFHECLQCFDSAGEIKSSLQLSREILRLSGNWGFLGDHKQAVPENWEVADGVDGKFSEVSQLVGMGLPVAERKVAGLVRAAEV